jgi:hypothetical protein
MGMTLNIPDSVLQGLRIPEGEIAQRLRTELAIAIYAQGAVLARLSGVNYSFALTTIISPDQRQLLFDS